MEVWQLLVKTVIGPRKDPPSRMARWLPTTASSCRKWSSSKGLCGGGGGGYGGGRGLRLEWGWQHGRFRCEAWLKGRGKEARANAV